MAESCHEENGTQIITHVEVTPSSGSDATVTVPLIDALLERGIPPEELTADTTFGSGRNAFEAWRRGTELVSPVAGSAPKGVVEQTGEQLSAADFAIDATGARATICPAGHSSIDEYEDIDASEKVEIHFARESCECCPKTGRVLLSPTLAEVLSEHGQEYVAIGVGTSGNAYLHNPTAEVCGGATIHPEFTLPRALYRTSPPGLAPGEMRAVPTRRAWPTWCAS